MLVVEEGGSCYFAHGCGLFNEGGPGGGLPKNAREKI